MTVRRSTAEHPFGTIKCWMGATHFLMKRLPKVKTEMALNVLAYNMKRVMAILGVVGLRGRPWRRKPGIYASKSADTSQGLSEPPKMDSKEICLQSLCRHRFQAILTQSGPVADARVAGISVRNWIKFRRQ